MKHIWLIFCMLLGCSSNALASSSQLFITPQISTLGVGVNIGKYIYSDLAIRANINGILDFSKNVSVSGINYRSKLKLFNMGLLADYYPFNNGFKVTTGIYYNQNKLQAHTNQFKYKGQVYNTNELGDFNASGKFNQWAPYIGIGYTLKQEKGWSFSGDLGVMYQGSFSSNYKFNCSSVLCQNSNKSITKIMEDSKSEFDKKVNEYKFFPVMSIGAIYRF